MPDKIISICYYFHVQLKFSIVRKDITKRGGIQKISKKCVADEAPRKIKREDS